MSSPKREAAPSSEGSIRERAPSASDVEFNYPTSYAATEPFAKPHTVVVLMVLLAMLCYAVFSMEGQSSTENAKTGIFAAISVGLIFCAEHLRDTLFIRPHPAIWRFVTGVGLFYAMFMTYLLFQDIADARALMPLLDAKVNGTELPHRDYAADCSLTYDSIMGAVLDEFMLAHLIGWIFKHMMIRDVGLSLVLSALFELMEYSFEFIQPNFKECWWDHWILDFALCNLGGIIIGELIMHVLETKTYSWGGIRDQPTIRGKLKRLALQFTPYNWTVYNLKMVSDFKRFAFVTCLVGGVMLVELDAFFLKDIFWVQPTSKLNVFRLLLWWAVGMVGLRDYYAWMTDPRIKRIGSTAWVMLAMMILEALVVFKFRAHLWKGVPPPTEVVVAWAVGLALLIGFVLVRFTPAGAWLRGATTSQTTITSSASDSSARVVGVVPVKAVPATPAVATVAPVATDDATTASTADSEDEVEGVASPRRRSRSPAGSARRRRSVPRGSAGAATTASTSPESSSKKAPRRI